MKTFRLLVIFVLPLAVFAGEVKVGDSAEIVRANLGLPRGQIQVGGREVFTFDRGEVELKSGVVTRVALRSEEAQAELKAKRAADALRASEELAIRRAQLIVEGEAIKARRLADPVFQASPLAHQVAFWEDFSRRYTDVPSAEQLTAVRTRLAAHVEASRVQTQRMAELEARIAEAEARAAEADARANRIRRPYYPYDNSSEYYPIVTNYRGSRHRSDRNDNGTLNCRPISPRPAAPARDQSRDNISSHTAEAFAGQSWLVWPSPTKL